MEPLVVTFRPVLSETRRGLWCPRCLLGTGVEVPVLVESGADVAVNTIRACVECGGNDVTDD